MFLFMMQYIALHYNVAQQKIVFANLVSLHLPKEDLDNLVYFMCNKKYGEY